MYKKEGTINADTSSEKEIFSLADVLKNIQGVSFISLQLSDKNNKPVSNNVYWMAAGNDFTSLKQMPKANLKINILKSGITSNNYNITIELSNTSSQLAFFINPQIMNGDDEVLPSFWSDNYFSIPSNSQKIITVSYPVNEISQEITQLKIEGWNANPQNISLPLNLNSSKSR